MLAIEISVSKKERIKQQDKYTNMLPSGIKALVVEWKQSVRKIK
jgi:hypothetical protein